MEVHGVAVMDYEKFFDEILELDKNIRYVGIYSKDKTYGKMREGLPNLLTPEESKKSLNDAIARWKTRTDLAHKIGEPLYAMAEYKKIKRITFPLDKERLILVSMKSEAYHEIITKELLEIRDKYISSP